MIDSMEPRLASQPCVHEQLSKVAQPLDERASDSKPCPVCAEIERMLRDGEVPY